MSRAKRLVPGVDSLEGKVLMTAGLVHAMEDETPVGITTLIAPVVSAPRFGEFTGSYTTGNSLPDTGATYKLSGAGLFKNLGGLSVTGSVSTPGFVRSNRVTGTITILGAGENDRLTLSIVSNQNPARNQSGSTFYFKTQSATGKFKNVVSTGKLHLTIGAGTETLGIQAASEDPIPVLLIGGPKSTTSGRFSMRIIQTKV